MTVSMEKRIGRPPIKRNEILDGLLEGIITGRWQPGDRIPTQVQLESMFDAGNPTIQSAIDRLAAAGFVVPRGRHGTFVAEYPPHLFRYGIVFPGSPHHGRQWSRFWQAIAEAARLLVKSNAMPGLQLPLIYNIEEPSASPEYEQLVDQLDLRAFAGLIFANTPFMLTDTPVLDAPGIARVQLATDLNPAFRHVLARYPDLSAFHRRAIEFLTSAEGQHRKRIGVVSVHLTPQSYSEIANIAKEYGAETKPAWAQAPALHSQLAVEHAIQAIFSARNPEDRPDALILDDDNIVTQSSRGLAATGLRIPQALTVVAYTNFPAIPESVVPVVRLGADICALLSDCIATAERIRKGEPVEDVRLVSPRFENEIA